MNESIIAIVGIIFGNAFMIVLVVAWWRTRQRKLELQADVQAKLIERLGATPELIEFLQSSAGREFVNGVQSGAVLQSRERIVAGISRSIILVFLGLAFGVICLVQRNDNFSIPAILCMALGAGFLVSALVSMRLGKSLGLP